MKDSLTVGSSGTNIPGTTTQRIEQTGSDLVTDPDGVQLTLPFASKEIDTDPLGHVTVRRFDSLHRLTSQTNAESRTKPWEYDGQNLTRESDYKGQFAQYHYDSLDRVKEIIDRAGQLTAISYDDTNGLTKTITDRRGNQRVEIYDPLGRQTSISVGG